MPFIIRNNDATELCITKGRKAMLWDGKRVEAYMATCIEHAFIKTRQTCKDGKIDGLPENVVPITRGSKCRVCLFK